jgi:CheY-like chemotaxis protein
VIKLLHVEDDADIREITKLSLSLFGEFEVVQCESGADALEQLATFTPDVIVLDMMMPGMTGREVLERMRDIPHLRHTPTLFMTARAQASEMEEMRAAGAVAVISKPFDPMTLGDQIKKAIA